MAEAAGDMIHQLNALGARGPVLKTLLFRALETRVFPTPVLLGLGLQAIVGPRIVRLIQRLKAGAES
jgi:hypothetical protein